MSTTYKILSGILLSRLTEYAEEIIVDHQYGFRRIRSTADHICEIFDKYLREIGNTLRQVISSL